MTPSNLEDKLEDIFKGFEVIETSHLREHAQDKAKLIAKIQSQYISKESVLRALELEGVFLWPKSLKVKKTKVNHDRKVRDKLRQETKKELGLE